MKKSIFEFLSKYITSHKVKYDRPGECSPEKDCLSDMCFPGGKTEVSDIIIHKRRTGNF